MSDHADPLTAQPPTAVVTAWCVLGGAGLMALLGAPAGVSILLVLLSVGIAVTYRTTARRAALAHPVPGTRVHDTDQVGELTAHESTTAAAWTTLAQTVTHGVEEVARMTDQELCREWRVSYIRLRNAQQFPHRSEDASRVSMQRCHYLNELECRYPQGFMAWMAAGARAASDPSPYLDRGLPHQHGEPPR